MWYLLERVSSASVKVDGEMISSIGKGLCVLVGIHRDDTKKEMEYIAKKILSIRLFDDPQTGKRWNKSVKDLDLEVLCVSQFTLHHILKVRNIHSNCSASILGAIHIWRQHPRGRGVNEMLTFSDMGGGGVWPMMTSAKKEIFLQLQQMHKQEHSTFEFEIEFFLEKT